MLCGCDVDYVRGDNVGAWVPKGVEKGDDGASQVSVRESDGDDAQNRGATPEMKATTHI